MGSSKSAQRARRIENEKKKRVTRAEASSAHSPQINQTQNYNQNSESSASDPAEKDQPTDTRRQWPWIYLVATGCLIFSPVLLTEHSLVLSWTQDSPVNWSAQSAIFYLGIIALIPFIHALAAAQALGTSGKRATKEDRNLSRQISEKALALVSIGILAGILYALFSLNGLQHSFKVTSVISDVSIVGGILGLAACMPYNIKITYVAMKRLRNNLPDRWLKTSIAFGIMDIFLFSKLVGLPQFISHLTG